MLDPLEIDGSPQVLWRHTAGGPAGAVGTPVFEIDGQAQPAVLRDIRLIEPVLHLPNHVHQRVFEGRFAADDDLALRLVFRTADHDPVVRFKYVLTSRRGRHLTKSTGRDQAQYFTLDWRNLSRVQEIRLAEFQESVHSFCLSELPVKPAEFANQLSLMGPLVLGADAHHTVLAAYEHGSQVPDAFLNFHLHADRRITLAAAKGNYAADTLFSETEPWETIWFQLAAMPGDEAAMAQTYRAFVLDHMSPNTESRKPYIFYNTWAYQERNKWWNGKNFLDSMHQERITQEIEIAHRMGVEVFVLDTGWFEKTGDWRVNTARFPDGLASIKRQLDAYGMKLGLWFDNAAAVSSHILAAHPDCIASDGVHPPTPNPVWETEPAYRMCLASPYWKAFADELIRLVREVGVTYFKWDAIGQYGCSDPRHQHGGPHNTPAERADCYAFEMGRAMTRIVDRLCAACPQAIVDFDITEGGRYVGLGFLAAGKYFLINNGPYYPNFDVPYDWQTATTWSNLFVYPGQARPRVCRQPLGFDKWIPSVLFLTHYLPDEPAASQEVNLASLILGQNGIWGDLLAVSDAGVARFARTLGLYKQVRDDITRADPVRHGAVGGSPEVHEKIHPATGRGVVVIFAAAAGRYVYITENRVATTWVSPQQTPVRLDPEGRAVLECTFAKPGAQVVFFGARE